MACRAAQTVQDDLLKGGEIMTTIAKIKCPCGKTFDYHFTIRKPDQGVQCPYCFAIMDESLQNIFDRAAATFHDANADLWKHAAGYNEPLWQFGLTGRCERITRPSTQNV